MTGPARAQEATVALQVEIELDRVSNSLVDYKPRKRVAGLEVFVAFVHRVESAIRVEP